MARDPLRGAWLARQLAPARVLAFARLRSTNRTAVALVEAGRLVAPALVLASRQTAGHGQRANRWWSDDGSLCATFLLPASEAIPAGQVPLRAGFAVASVLARRLPPGSVRLKWPNDVLVNGRKIAGLLCLRARDADLIGLGLNVRTDLRHAPADVRARATALAREMPNPPRRDELARELWAALCAERAADDWRERFEQFHLLRDRPVRVQDDGVSVAGLCRGIDEKGRLLVEADDVVHALTGGTVEWA
jgi:BirA family biotin operon repressor/biotin-[acetyl-CoA-carboxylase] ligase